MRNRVNDKEPYNPNTGRSSSNSQLDDSKLNRYNEDSSDSSNETSPSQNQIPTENSPRQGSKKSSTKTKNAYANNHSTPLNQISNNNANLNTVYNGSVQNTAPQTDQIDCSNPANTNGYSIQNILNFAAQQYAAVSSTPNHTFQSGSNPLKRKHHLISSNMPTGAVNLSSNNFDFNDNQSNKAFKLIICISLRTLS